MTEANSQRTYARLAGLMYVVVIALDIAGLLIVSQVTGNGNFVTAAHSIKAAEALYRVGLGLLLAGSLGVIVLGAALYVTLKPIDDNLALMALLFRTVEAAVGLVGVITSFTVLRLELAATQTGAFSPANWRLLADMATNGVGMQVAAITFQPRLDAVLLAPAAVGLHPADSVGVGDVRVHAVSSRLAAEPDLAPNSDVGDIRDSACTDRRNHVRGFATDHRDQRAISAGLTGTLEGSRPGQPPHPPPRTGVRWSSV